MALINQKDLITKKFFELYLPGNITISKLYLSNKVFKGNFWSHTQIGPINALIIKRILEKKIILYIPILSTIFSVFMIFF